jgi:hypothetical protein
MRWFRPLVVVLLGVFVFGGVVAVGASARKATPEILPVGGFTDKSGEVEYAAQVLFGESTFTCASTTSHGGFTTSRLGTFDILIENCLSELLGSCTGLGDTAGSSSILVLGTFHLRYRETGTSTKSVIAYLLIPVHYTCTGLMESLIEWRGCLAGEVTPVNSSITLTGSPNHFTMTANKTPETTRNEITKIANEAGTALETCALEAKEDSSAFGRLAVQASDEVFPTSSTSEIMS